MKSIDVFPWDDNFNTGLPEIDGQHRRLVSLLNQLASQFTYDVDNIDLSTIFDELLDYTVYHFETEEAIWREYLPADAHEVQHRQTHQRFVRELQALIAEQQEKSPAEVAEHTLEYLVQWLASHILESDRHMAYIVLGLQEGLSLESAKAKADEMVSGFTKKMSNIILSLYRTLTNNTLKLMQELVWHKEFEAELIEARRHAEEVSKQNQQANQDLNYQRGFLKTLIQSLPDLIWLKDPEGIYLGCNPRFEQFFGALEKDIVGKRDIDFMSEDKAAFFREHDLKAIEVGGPSVNEEQITFADGHIEQLETIKTPMFDENGDLIGVLGVGRDITGRAEMVEAILDRERTFSTLVSNIPGIAYRSARDHHWTMYFISDQVEQITGYPASDFINNGVRSYESVIHPEDSEYVDREVNRAVELGRPWEINYRVCHRNGNIRWVYEKGENVVDESGQVAYLDGFILDITDRVRSEERLRQAASVFDSAREGIVITDPKGLILEVNSAFARITGYCREEVVGKNPRLLSSGRHDKAFYVSMWETLLDQGHWSGEIWNRRKCGEVYAENLTISAVYDGGGALQHYVGLFADITALKEQQRKLEQIAHYDILTGLPNRVLLADRLYQAMAQSQRRNSLVGVAYLDLDGFKYVNDTHGHDIGDQFLIRLSERMQDALREPDTLSRLGGDEFVVLLLDLPDHSSSAPIIERLLSAIAEPIHIQGEKLQVSASLGVTFYPQAEELDADQLLRQADQAMYQAKQTGRNRYQLFDEEHDKSIRGEYESLERIRSALRNNEMVLYYQPKVNMRSGEVIGVEALIRWRHPERELLPPGAFLPAVGRHPFAVELGEWVLDTAMSQIETWRQMGKPLQVSVNIDGIHLQQTIFVERLSEFLKRHPGVQPGDLELEVLETSALEDIEHVSSLIDECRKIGISFALDDFGTGYSSLIYLKRLPASLLKIDQSFVRDMLEDSDDLAILEGVLGLSVAFGRQAIAEGVETLAHGEMLLQMGCALGQGYAIAHPMPAEQIPQWLEQWRPDASWENALELPSEDQALLFAAVEHRAWVGKLLEYLEGVSNKPPVFDRHRCRFGMWLDRQGRERYRESPVLEPLISLHEEIHREAEVVVGRVTAGKREMVPAQIEGFKKHRDELLVLLRQLLETSQ